MNHLPPEICLFIIHQVSKRSPRSLFELRRLNRTFRKLLQDYCTPLWYSAAKEFIIQDPQFHKSLFKEEDPFLLFSAINMLNLQAVQALIYARVNLNTRLECYHYTPLLLAVSMDSLPLTTMLLRGGADALLETYSVPLDVKAISQITPLHCAAKFGHLDLCKKLISKIDIHATTLSGKTALHFASYRTTTSSRILKLLLDHGSDPAAVDIHGYTPLHVAAMHGNSSAVKLLVQAQSNVDPQTKKGNTPLHFAVQQDHSHVCKTLMEAGANPHIANLHGETAIDELMPENLNMDLRDIVSPRQNLKMLCWASLSFLFFGFKLVYM
jgi:ankyrin repeat protein